MSGTRKSGSSGTSVRKAWRTSATPAESSRLAVLEASAAGAGRPSVPRKPSPDADDLDLVVGPDLEGADLRSLDANRVYLVKANLRDANLDYAKDVEPALGPELDLVWLEIGSNRLFVSRPSA